MVNPTPSALHALPCGLCEDPAGDATALVARMAKRDTAALAELHQMWGASLFGIACRMMGDRHSAGQALIDAFALMWRRAGRYDPHEMPPFVWAFSILRDHCADRLRSRRPAPRKATDEAIPVQFQPPPEVTENPRVMTADDWRRIKSAIRHLPPDERCCLELAVFLEFTRHPSAACANPATGAVKNRLRRAVDRLREELSRYEL